MSAAEVIHMPTVGVDIERVILGGDLSKLTPDQRLSYYNAVCKSLNLNPLTKPFAYLQLSGKTVLYATKDCTEQLRNNHGISLKIASREVLEGVYVVTAGATGIDGRHDESTGAVSIDGLKGESRANAMMKAETKAKRRVTLSICGLGMLDESEVDSIPGAEKIDTGGHPTGTREAQEFVRDQKLAAPKPPEKPEAFKMLDAFKGIKADLKKLLGTDDKYYQILGSHGFEKSSQITDRVKGASIYGEMRAAFKDAMNAATSDKDHITNEDVPAIIRSQREPGED